MRKIPTSLESIALSKGKGNYAVDAFYSCRLFSFTGDVYSKIVNFICIRGINLCLITVAMRGKRSGQIGEYLTDYLPCKFQEIA